MMPRLLLVELMPDEPERQRRAHAYPLLLGLARACGWPAWWRALGVPYSPTLLYELERSALRLLLAEARRRRPTVIVINERLKPDQEARLRTAGGGARLACCPLDEGIDRFAWFARRSLPGAPAALLRDPALLDRLRPEFRRAVLNPKAAPWAARPLVGVVVGPRCSYRTPVAGNPHYRRLGLRARAIACSFCGAGTFAGHEPAAAPVSDPVAFAARHIEAACRAPRPAGVEARFELVGPALWRRLEELLAVVAGGGATRAELCFMPRIDDLLAARGAISRGLPRLARRGLALRIFGMGVENFSAEENARLNKGISAAQVHEAAAFIEETKARWPGRFRFDVGELSMILFTPWTRLEDLRTNVEHIERCPLVRGPAVLGRRLQLFEGRPIARLAAAEGLLARRRGAFYNSGCIVRFDQSELPWRFRHPKVEPLWRLGLALSELHAGRGAQDSDVAAVAAALGPSPAAADFVRRFSRALDAAARLRTPAKDLASLLQ